jgi:ATP-dependent 26S proteasome regulatory subunit
MVMHTQVKTLFAVAGVMQPSVIFIDEIDSIMSARKADGGAGSSG